MSFWRSAKSVGCPGRMAWLTFAVLFLAATFFGVQAKQQIPKKSATGRANEFTLAGLRPGRDKLDRAMQLYHAVDPQSSAKDSQAVWVDVCAKHMLIVDFDNDKRIQVIRTGLASNPAGCRAAVGNVWRTGHGLGVGDSAAKLAQIYGQPDSKSPSTRDGQPLELWYYAFDWAGPDVPQVMEVLCTREKAGQPGRVIEITLAAPSL